MVPERDDEESGGEQIEEKTEGVTVEPEDETPDDRPAQTEEERQTRKERRQNRMRQEQERAKAAEERERKAAEELAEVRRQLAETRGYVSALGERQNQNDPEAARKAKIDTLESESERHLANAGTAAAAKDQTRAQAEMRAYNAKQREIARIEMRAEMEPEIDQRFQRYQQQQPLQMTPQLIQAREALIREFPWFTTNKRAVDAADAEVERRMRGGQPFTYEMARAVAAEVQRDLNLKISNPPSERSRAVYAAPGGGEGEGSGEGPVTVKMGRAEKVMAHKLYPGLDPVEAEKKWAREVGAPEERRKARAAR